MTESTYKYFFFLLSLKLLSLFGDWFNYVVKFAIYYLYYKDKFVENSTQSFIYTVNFLHFLYNLENLLATFVFTYNSSACIAKPDLVTKKEKLPRTSLYLIFCPFQSLSLFNLTIFKYIAIYKW